MTRPGQITGGPSQKYSGVIDLRDIFSGLVETSTGQSKKLAFGTVLMEWTVKGFVSATKELVTGMSKVDGFAGIAGTGEQAVLVFVNLVGGTISLQLFTKNENAIGHLVNCLWLAVGE